MQAETDSRGGWLAVGVIWAIAIVGSVVVISLAYGGTTAWLGDTDVLGVYDALGVVLATSVVGALVAQLATRRPAGYVVRASASVGGAVVVVALAALAVAPTLAA
ncbi:hypothetical protein [Agromyces aureus]|uniref:Major facilitator superfamily (MFS) profile domain-containing protein n=1 Tax=Agromyces aureus TaxID=453304 RepID=A0A191WDR7_9MICO|nr:hypothetical protein [Agromyces aureus]ANJ26367.1 hypothetical protein ATC03_06180 [Agromyces aureus]